MSSNSQQSAELTSNAHAIATTGHRPSSKRKQTPSSHSELASSPMTAPAPTPRTSISAPLILAGYGGLGAGLVALLLWAQRRSRGEQQRCKDGSATSGKGAATSAGPNSKLKPSPRCAPLADGSCSVMRREIAADNSCLFNSVGYVMHKSKIRAPHLRNVVAQQVASDRALYSDAFLGMTNDAYCNWIRQPYNWGGGIELSILAKAYGVEIAAWNIETCKEHVFGEESGYKRRVMVIYNGVHYDALAVSASPRANPEEDETSFNPRSRRGKMILAAARKLVELAHKDSQYHNAPKKPATPTTASTTKTSDTNNRQRTPNGTTNGAVGPDAKHGAANGPTTSSTTGGAAKPTTVAAAVPRATGKRLARGPKTGAASAAAATATAMVANGLIAAADAVSTPTETSSTVDGELGGDVSDNNIPIAVEAYVATAANHPTVVVDAAATTAAQDNDSAQLRYPVAVRSGGGGEDEGMGDTLGVAAAAAVGGGGVCSGGVCSGGAQKLKCVDGQVGVVGTAGEQRHAATTEHTHFEEEEVVAEGEEEATVCEGT